MKAAQPHDKALGMEATLPLSGIIACAALVRGLCPQPPRIRDERRAPAIARVGMAQKPRERERSQGDRNPSLWRASTVAAIVRSRSVIRGAAKSMKARNLSGSSRSRA